MALKNIIVTGSGGLIGPLLAARLLNDGYRVIMTDLVQPIVPKTTHPENAVSTKGDICDAAYVTELLDLAQPLHAIFIFHGIMSAGSEANYDLSMKVNVESVRNLLLTLRVRNPGVRVVYSSSQAVFGQPLPDLVLHTTPPTPEGTYGSHKFLTEVMINDMHRKKFIDAFIVRFPTLVVRPGLPSHSAASWLSGIIREPMKGEECVIPLTDRSLRSNICSVSGVIENLVRVLNLKSDSLPNHIRHINFPGVSATTQDLMDGLKKYGGEDKLKYLREEMNEGFERILRSWPQGFDNSVAESLGLFVDKEPGDLVKEYIDSLKT